jgi:hypothetical protein
MNKTTLLYYYFFLAVSAVFLETTSAAPPASPLGNKKLQQSSVLTDNFKLLNVAGDGRPSHRPHFSPRRQVFSPRNSRISVVAALALISPIICVLAM